MPKRKPLAIAKEPRGCDCGNDDCPINLPEHIFRAKVSSSLNELFNRLELLQAHVQSLINKGKH